MDSLSIANRAAGCGLSSACQSAARAILYGFLTLTILPGCGANDFPCESILDDDALLRMSIAVQRHKDLGIDKSDAVIYCDFVTPSESQQQHDCCWWVADEIYGHDEDWR
jgi:hypothetical protein